MTPIWPAWDRGYGQCGFNGPSVCYQAGVKSRVAQAFQSCPFLNRVCLSIVRQFAYGGFVVFLLIWCGPSTVIWLIVSVVVNAINRMIGWSWTHVFEKGLERIQPALTDHDAASAIPVKLMMLRIQAPAFDAFPCSVNACSRTMNRMAMSWFLSIGHGAYSILGAVS